MFSDVCVSSAATFDVQRTTVKGGSEIEVTVQFISNSRAPGCFVVLQGDYGSSDEFGVLMRDASKPNVDVMIGAPRFNYAVYVYDLKIGEHINTDPASIQDDRISVTQGKLI